MRRRDLDGAAATALRLAFPRKDPRSRGLRKGVCAASRGQACACSGACLVPMTQAEIEHAIDNPRGVKP